MAQEAQELLQWALALPDNDRAELAGNLIACLDTTVNEDGEMAWQQEVITALPRCGTFLSSLASG
jgi:hypothetical protein